MNKTPWLYTAYIVHIIQQQSHTVPLVFAQQTSYALHYKELEFITNTRINGATSDTSLRD